MHHPSKSPRSCVNTNVFRLDRRPAERAQAGNPSSSAILRIEAGRGANVSKRLALAG